MSRVGGHLKTSRRRWGRGPSCGGGPTGACSTRRVEVGPEKEGRPTQVAIAWNPPST